MLYVVESDHGSVEGGHGNVEGSHGEVDCCRVLPAVGVVPLSVEIVASFSLVQVGCSIWFGMAWAPGTGDWVGRGGGWLGFKIKGNNTGLAGGASRWRLDRGDKLVARIFGFARSARWCRELYPIKISLGP